MDCSNWFGHASTACDEAEFLIRNASISVRSCNLSTTEAVIRSTILSGGNRRSDRWRNYQCYPARMATLMEAWKNCLHIVSGRRKRASSSAWHLGSRRPLERPPRTSSRSAGKASQRRREALDGRARRRAPESKQVLRTTGCRAFACYERQCTCSSHGVSPPNDSTRDRSCGLRVKHGRLDAAAP